MIQQYLDDLENRIDPAVEDDLYSQWISFWEGGVKDEVFIPRRQKKAPSSLRWPEVSVNSTLNDYELMALQQFRICSDLISDDGGGLLNVRCNYGTGIIPSLFGTELFMMEEKTNTLPTTRPVEGGEDELIKILDKGVPSVNNGLGAKVFEMAQEFIELTKHYPKTRKYVSIYHPDIQGPMDICELLYGSSLFIALVDKADFIHKLLSLITETYTLFMEEWRKIVPFGEGYSTHWSMLYKGNIMLRDDSAMNLSPGMFDEFIKPYDGKLLKRFGGGGIHFCGRGDHYIEKASQFDGLYAIHMSQPEYNDMETILKNTVDRGIRIIGLKRDSAEELKRNGRDLRKCVQSF